MTIPITAEQVDEIAPDVELEPGDAITGRDAVDLYVRTYNTILRSSGDVKVRAFEPAHVGVGSSLHLRAGGRWPDAGAFIYSVQRLPTCVAQVERVVLGQLPEQFGAVLDGGIEGWRPVQAPGRRRQWHFDGDKTLAVSIASPSDLDDVIPTLVAYQIEWNKLHRLLNAHAEFVARLRRAQPPGPGWLQRIGEQLRLPAEDWARLRRIWGPSLWPTLQAIGRAEKSLRARMLGGTHVGYAKLVDRWWQPIGAALAERGLDGRPLYFVSSNPHGIVNLVSGYVRRRAEALWAFLEQGPEAEEGEIATLRRERARGNPENVLYYASRLWHARHPEAPAKEVRSAEERERGILTISPSEGLDVCAQIIELARLRREDLDPRVAELGEVLRRSDAVVLNIDYPLGMAAYYIMREVAESVPNLRGVYVLGKAATLNGAIGDVMIADVVSDEHTHNVYSFPNAFSYDDVAPWLERGSVLDSQKAVTVKGTFLQNREFLEFFYRGAYTVVEMEAGPYLSAVYEATYPDRHPYEQPIHFRDLPFDFGLIHYASDTPYTRARTLGSRRLSFEGIDSTYASTAAILRRVLRREAERIGGREDGRA
jgi:hypothetical protein